MTSVAVSEDGRSLATGTTEGELFLWRRSSPKRGRSKGKAKGGGLGEALPLPGHTGSVARVAFTPDQRWLISAAGSELRMWDLQAKDPSISSIVLPGHTGDIAALEFAAGGRAVTGASDNAVRVWDLEKSLRAIDSEVLDGHQAPVRVLDVSADGLRIVSGSDDSTVRVWDALGRSAGRSATLLRVGPSAVQDFAVAETGRVLGVSTERATLWSLSDRARWRAGVSLDGVPGQHSSAAMDAAGARVAIGTESGRIFAWTVDAPDASPVVLEGHAGPINALAFLEDGRLISGSSDASVRVWDLADPQSASVWSGHTDEVHQLLAVGGYVFAAALDGSIVRWTIADGASTPLQGHQGEVLQIRAAPDGSRIVSVGADRRVRVWNVESPSDPLVLRGHDEPVHAAALGRNGVLATGGEDRRIFLWDLSAEHPDEAPRVLVGHEQSVTALAFTRDPEVLASSSNDQSVRLWRLDTDRQLVLRGHDQVVSGLAVSSDGVHLVSAGYDGTLRIWPLAHTSFTRLVCEAVGESLPPGRAAEALGVPVADPCSPTGRR